MNTSIQHAPQPLLTVATDWQPFADRLAAALATLEEDQNLILNMQHRQRFVQFAGADGPGLRAESISNAYLPPTDQLSADQVAALMAVGWCRPTHEPGAGEAERKPAGSPNFFADFDAPVSFDEVADLAVRTLVQIFEVSHPDQLEYDAFDTKGNAISFPGLCRRRAPQPGSAAESELLFAQALLATVREVSGLDKLEFDKDGDICLYRGSQAVYVRRVEAMPFVCIWSPLMRGVDVTPELLAHLNALNAGAVLARFSVRNGGIIAEAELAAEPMVTEHVNLALSQFCRATKGVAAMLQREFGGRAANGDLSPAALPH